MAWWRPRDVEPARLERSGEQLDVCTGVAYAISIVDPIRGAYLPARAVLLTLQLGDARRLASALALHATFYAAAGAKNASVVESLFTAARRWIAESGSIEPRSFFWALYAEAQIDLYEGRPEEAVAPPIPTDAAMSRRPRPYSYFNLRTSRTFRIVSRSAMCRCKRRRFDHGRLSVGGHPHRNGWSHPPGIGGQGGGVGTPGHVPRNPRSRHVGTGGHVPSESVARSARNTQLRIPTNVTTRSRAT